jgi:DNA replication protein DnaC
MERLSDIMRTTQGSRSAADQRLPQHHAPIQGQRQAPPVRRSLPEPDSRMGGTDRTPEAYHTRSAPPSRISEVEAEVWEEPAPAPSRSAARPPYNDRRPMRPGQFSRYAEQPPQGDYYAEEESPPLAEFQEDWNDDTAGMRYGDWESEPGHYPAHNYQQEDGYVPPTPRSRETRPDAQQISLAAQRLAHPYKRGGAPVSREQYHTMPENTRNVVSRDQREARLPVPTHGSQLAPIAQNQRTTQPLKPQQVSQVNLLRAEIQQRSVQRTPEKTPTFIERPTVSVPAPYNNTAEICAICKGAGYLRIDVPYGHPNFGKPVTCKCKEKAIYEKRRLQIQETSNLRDLMDKKFSNFDPRVSQEIKEAYQITKKYAQDPYGWLVIMGKTGCGKTHLAAAIANQYLETGASVLFSTVSDLLDHLRATFVPSAEIVYDQLFARMREASLLILDDLGAQQSSSWANEKLFQLLNYRYNLKIPTVITTNITPGQGYIEERIRSRMSDISFVTTLNLERARDYRPNNPHRS